MEKIYTAGKNFTLPPGLTGWTNFTSATNINNIETSFTTSEVPAGSGKQ